MEVRVLVKITVFQLSRKSPSFMELRSSLSYSQVRAFNFYYIQASQKKHVGNGSVKAVKREKNNALKG